MIERPWTLKVELVRGCNLKCGFCPGHKYPEYSEAPSFIDLELLSRFAHEFRGLKDNPRIELTMRGEPTLHPQVEAAVGVLRGGLPAAQISLFTNGVRLLKTPELVLKLLSAGVNILNIDCYNGTYNRFQKLVGALGLGVEDFRSFSAYKRYPNGHKLRVVNLVPDIADPSELVSVRKLHTNAGNLLPWQLERYGIVLPTLPRPQRCGRPFREFVLAVDGSVLVCCHDWGAEGVVGRYPESGVEEIWYGSQHRVILAELWGGCRGQLVPCNRCDYFGGYRLGFLKNPSHN